MTILNTCYPEILNQDDPSSVVKWIRRNGISDDIIKIIEDLKEKIDKIIQERDLDEILSPKEKIQQSKERREYEHPS